MKLQQLIAAAREETGDTENPPRVSDAAFTRYANDAQNQACRRARLLIDSTTPELCTINFGAGQSSVDLDERVLYVRRVKLAGRTLTLKRINLRDLDESRPGWEDDRASEPTHFVPDENTGTLRLYPTPSADGTLYLTVVRLPLEEMATGDDTPEIRSDLHWALVAWMRRCYYRRPDSQVFDAKAAGEAEAEFTVEFGARPSAQDEAWIAREYDQDGHEGVY